MSSLASVCLVALLAYLKVHGILNIGWLLVFAPIWIPTAIILAVMMFAALVSIFSK